MTGAPIASRTWQQERDLLRARIRVLEVAARQPRHLPQQGLHPRELYLGRTVTDSGGDYPDADGDTFYCVLLDGTFTRSPGDQTPTLTELSADGQVIAHAFRFIPAGAEVLLWHEARKNRWWIVAELPVAPDVYRLGTVVSGYLGRSVDYSMPPGDNNHPDSVYTGRADGLIRPATLAADGFTVIPWSDTSRDFVAYNATSFPLVGAVDCLREPNSGLWIAYPRPSASLEAPSGTGAGEIAPYHELQRVSVGPVTSFGTGALDLYGLTYNRLFMYYPSPGIPATFMPRVGRYRLTFSAEGTANSTGGPHAGGLYATVEAVSATTLITGPRCRLTFPAVAALPIRCNASGVHTLYRGDSLAVRFQVTGSATCHITECRVLVEPEFS